MAAPRPPTAAELAGNSVPIFVRAHSRRNVLTGHLARWKVGICPFVAGLSPAFDAFVVARIRAIATAVGAPTQPYGKCSGNVFIAFTTQPQRFLDVIAKRAPNLLGFHYPDQTRALATMTRAIQSWYATSTLGCRGDEMLDVSHYWPGGIPGACLGSRLGNGQRTLIDVVLIIVDLRKVLGDEIGMISDYLAALSLTQAQTDRCGNLPSILDLLARDCP